MIKLKNLWKIALATMAMSTMLVACDTAKEDDDNEVVDTTVYVKYPTEAKVSGTGVYTAKLPKEGADLTGGFASVAGEKESIKVVLAPKDVVAKIIDKKITSDSNLFTDENKCYVYANNDVGNGVFTSTKVVKGTYVQPAGYEEYVGLAITKDADGNYIVKFDITKINTSILLAKSSADSTIGEKGESKVDADADAWGAVDKLKTDYIPMVLGSVTGNSGAHYSLNFWNAGVAIMEPTEENYPTTIEKEKALVIPPLADMKYVRSNFGDISITFSDDVATAKITYALANNTWKQSKLSGIEFGVCGSNGWDEKYTGAEITALDTPVALKFNASTNNTVASNVLEDGKTYVLTINAKDKTVKVSEE